jgi:hypothetical protein
LHTVDKTIDVRSNYIDVHEGVQGEANLGDYRKFKACYTVFRKSGPSPIRITSIEAAIIMTREPTNNIAFLQAQLVRLCIKLWVVQAL